jgi:NADPH:quinone reductase-like Zn-dependent oxidoreductase
VNLIVDIVGASYMARNLDALALDGRLVILAALGDSIASFDIWQLLKRRLSISASSMKQRTVAQKGVIIASLRKQVWPLLDDGRIRPLVDSVFRFEDVAAAHTRLEASEHTGKIVLRIADLD